MNKSELLRALVAGIACAEMLIKQGGSLATELSEEDLPLLRRALAFACQLDDEAQISTKEEDHEHS